MRRKRSSVGIVILMLFIISIGALAYIYNSNLFERKMPKINLASVINWNLKKPIKINISDDSGIKFIRVTLSDGSNSIVLKKKVYEISQKKLSLDIEFPRTGFIGNKKQFVLSVEAVDSSKWNFFAGNQTITQALINVDTRRPELYIINNSYKIIKGGVAAVVFKAKDQNLENLYIQTNFGKKFYPTPFYKEGYYISLLAWPSNEKTFSAKIIAVDKAGNTAKERVRFYLKNKKYRVSRITLSDRFLDGKIMDLAEDNSADPTLDRLARFKFVNETLRIANGKIIKKITSQVPTEIVDEFKIDIFCPLKNAAAVASFGDHRFYKYKANEVSESYHLGLDLASTAEADIVSSSKGTVVFAKYNGIYGDTVILSHGLGVYSLYSHCSSLLVEEGEEVQKNQVIAKTGVTGLALGDHLHFGMAVQGIEVRPEEWMDVSWLQDNVFGVIENAKKIIDR